MKTKDTGNPKTGIKNKKMPLTPIVIQIYTGILNSIGSANPTVNVIHNTLDGQVTWVRSGLGTYTGTLTGAFPLNKTAIFIQNGSLVRLTWAIRTSDNVITLTQKSTAMAVVDALLNVIIEIRNYN